MRLESTGRGLTLDAGALIGIERRARAVQALLAEAKGTPLIVPAAALGQVWRGGARQARLAAFMRTRDVKVVPLDERTARLAGELCAATGTSDVVDACVVVCARSVQYAVLTSDPDDLRRLDPHLDVITI